MIETPVVTTTLGDLGYLYDRNGRAHPILKRTNSFVFTDDPVSRRIAQRLKYGDAGFRLKPFRRLRLARWGFDAMHDCVAYDMLTRTAVNRLGLRFVASLHEDDIPRHTKPPRSPDGKTGEASSTAGARKVLGIDRQPPLTREDVLIAFKLKAKQHHPDNGGDPDLFRIIVAARDHLLETVET